MLHEREVGVQPPSSKCLTSLSLVLQAFQIEQKELSREGKRIVVSGAGHGSLLFVREHAQKTAQAISDLVREVGHGPMPVWWIRYHTV